MNSKEDKTNNSGAKDSEINSVLEERTKQGKNNYPHDLISDIPEFYERNIKGKYPLPLLMVAGVDGWGFDEDDNMIEKKENLFTKAKTPWYWRFWNNPKTWKSRLKTRGSYLLKVVPDHQGSSEKGWHYLGTSMETTPQDIILKSIYTGEFLKNEAFLNLMKRIKSKQDKGNKKAALHIMAPIMTDKGIHHYDIQVYCLLKMAAKIGLSNVYVWVGSDGRDTSQGRPITQYMEKLYGEFEKNGAGEIAGVFGRGWLDRASNFELTKKLYDFWVNGIPVVDEKYPGKSVIVDSNDKRTIMKEVKKQIDIQISAGRTEQTIKSIGVKKNGELIKIKNGDGVIWSPFRKDRARMPIAAFAEDRKNPHLYKLKNEKDTLLARQKFIDNFKDEPLLDLDIVATWEYYENMPSNVVPAFRDIPVKTHLVKELINIGCRVLIVTEGTKENFMQSIFLGNDRTDYSGKCDFKIFPSIIDSQVAEHPEMASYEIRDFVLEQMKLGIYDVIITNICPPDMVTHVGKNPEIIKAVEATDSAFGPLMQRALEQEGSAIFISDHGSADRVIEVVNGKEYPDPAHTDRDVPFMVISREKHRLDGLKLKKNGRLIDFAPTVLKFFGVKKGKIPKEWDGESLLLG